MAGILQLRTEATKANGLHSDGLCCAPGAQFVPDAHSCEPGEPGPRLSAGGIVSPTSPTVLAEPSTGSHCAELGQRPRRRGRHTMSPGAPGIGTKASFLNCPALCGMPPLQPSSRVSWPDLCPSLIWLCFRNHLEEAHSLPSSGVYQPSQRRCQELRTCDRLCSLPRSLLSD